MLCLRTVTACSRRIGKRFVVTDTFSGRLDGSVDMEASSRTHFNEIEHDSVKLLNNQLFLVQGGNEHGFMINKSFVAGPVLLLPNIGFLHWKLDSIEDATTDSLFLISRLFPKIDMLLMGSGEIINHPSPTFRKACQEFNMGLQVESTQQAIRTYGILLEDKRNFAALLIPSAQKQITDPEKVYLQKVKIARNKVLANLDKEKSD